MNDDIDMWEPSWPAILGIILTILTLIGVMFVLYRLDHKSSVPADHVSTITVIFTTEQAECLKQGGTYVVLPAVRYRTGKTTRLAACTTKDK